MITPNWLPIRCDLHDDPAVIAVATAIGMDEHAVVGRLVRLWAWANEQLPNGNAPGVTEKWIDRYVGVDGFASALVFAGWLTVNSTGVTFPKFDVWNSKGAKRRILTARRVQNHRRKSGNADVTQPALPRERERVIEENPPNPPSGGRSGERKRKPKPPQHPEAVPVPASLDTPEFRAVWADWIADRRTRKKPLTELAAKQQLDDLAPFGSAQAVKAVRKSIAAGWAGVFTDDLKPLTPPATPPPARRDIIPKFDQPNIDPLPFAQAAYEQMKRERAAKQEKVAHDQQPEAAVETHN